MVELKVNTFQTDYESILQKLDDIDPVSYGKTRNFIDGAVTYLSPYISRGVISTKFVLAHVLKKGYQFSDIESFVKELCWRDYFQRIAQIRNLDHELKQAQYLVSNHSISTQIVNAHTGIDGIDRGINELYENGYMHNHCRMYVASLVCNIVGSHWLLPAQWMYYHLLDGDWPSNVCSWQWVAGTKTGKRYFANQANINTYTNTDQKDTFLDVPYEDLPTIEIPEELLDLKKLYLSVELPVYKELSLDPSLPTFIYNYYNLDPMWHVNEVGNRILLLEPAFFARYPVSKKCIDFMLSLSQNIPGIQVYIGSFQSFKEKYHCKIVVFKEHPLNIGYIGIQEERDWICNEVIGDFPSFFGYWKQVSKYIS
jgi:deoxyribodipyrimidine photo-lyase